VGYSAVKIFFFYESIDLGGQQTQTLQLLRRLSARSHQVGWLYLYGRDLVAEVEQVGAAIPVGTALLPGDYKRQPWKVIKIIMSLTRILKKDSPDFIVSGSGLGSFIVGVAARMLGIKHYRLMGCSLKQVEPTLLKYYRPLCVDKLIDLYLGWPEVFRELQSVGVSEAKCVALPPAVDSNMFFPNEKYRAKTRDELGIPAEEFVIGWIGRISRDMQVGNTIKTAKIMFDKGVHDFKVLLVGGGPWLQDLKQEAAELGLANHTIFTGWVPMHEVPAYVNAMDVVPLLELDPQGGSIVREAMACGRVALSVGGKSGTQASFMLPDCACLVSPENYIEEAVESILALKGDPVRRQYIGRHAATYASQHMSFDNQVNVILEKMYSHNTMPR